MLFKNANANTADRDCRTSIRYLRDKLKYVPQTDLLHKHFTQYAVVICSSALERAFKNIIADYVSNNATPQLCEYIDKKIRQSPSNPRLEVIKKVLGDFDEAWVEKYKAMVSKMPRRKNDALASLVENRNKVAHGMSISVSFKDVVGYYYQARDVVIKLEEVLC